MNHLAARLLTRLYPRPWRDRYGAEFETFLQSGEGGFGTSANVILSATWEHIFPTRGSNMDRDPHSFQLQSWCVRAPWAIFGLAPLLLLAGAWFVALSVLWSGWKIFLPGTDTPFIRVYELREIVYFNIGRLLYFVAPIIVGWGIGLIATRQRSKAVWPTIGLVLIAFIGGTAQVHASRIAVHSGIGHISMDFALGTSVQGVPNGLFHALVIFLLTALPYLFWRLQKARTLFS
jgi:hypothetical protein